MDVEELGEGWYVLQEHEWEDGTMKESNTTSSNIITISWVVKRAVNLKVKLTATYDPFHGWKVDKEGSWLNKDMFIDWTNPTEREILAYEITTGKKVDWIGEK